MRTRRDFGRLALALAASAPAAVRAADLQETHLQETSASAEILALYRRFLTAQNARDLVAVRATLWDSPDFLWVSDGRPFWGPDALVERMAGFQKAEVWRVEPHFARSRAVEVGEGVAYLSLPLTLTIGAAAAPSALPWLVGVLCRRGPEGWRIAALFTTTDKSA